MIDTHCHLNFPELKDDLSGVMERAKQAGVTDFIVPGTDLESSTSSIDMSGQFENVYAAIGLHPTEVTQCAEGYIAQMRRLLSQKGKVVAVGEVGLDYYHFEDCPTEKDKQVRKVLQARVFSDFIALAKDYSLPLIIHSREAFDDTYTILARESVGMTAVIHCFSGTREEAERYLEIGCHLSFTAIITYLKNEELREVIKEIPLEKLMLETDAPFLPPEGHRGEKGEPRFVREVAQCVAELRGMSIEEVDQVTTATAKRFFKLPHG